MVGLSSAELWGRTLGSNSVLSPTARCWLCGGKSLQIERIRHETGKPLHGRPGTTPQSPRLAFGPDGIFLAAADAQGLIVWDLSTAQVREFMEARGDDSSTRLLPSREPRRWQYGSRKSPRFGSTARWRTRKLAEQSGLCLDMAFSPDGKWLATTDRDVVQVTAGGLVRWQACGCATASSPGRCAAVPPKWSIAGQGRSRETDSLGRRDRPGGALLDQHQPRRRDQFLPDDRTIAVLFQNGEVWLWSRSDSEKLDRLPPPRDGFHGGNLAPTGRLAVLQGTDR